MSFTVRTLKENKPRRRWPWKSALMVALTFSRPVVRWYLEWKREQEAKEHRALLIKRLLMILVAGIVAFTVFAALGKAVLSVKDLGIKSIATVAGVPMPKDSNGFTNILLLGQGDEGHDGKDLTDTIMIASLDPSTTRSAVLLSFPRDMYFLKTEKMGKGKLNSMYRDYKSYLHFQKEMEWEDASREAMRELANELGRITDLQIHHIVKVDFEGFVKGIDAIGGIDVDVPYDIVDTEYPDENYGYETFEIRAGLQHLDGVTALKYARSRHTTSDFGRSARQQQIISVAADKAKSAGIITNPSTLTELWNIVSQNVETTLSLREIIGLAELSGDLDKEKIITMQLNDRNALYDGFVEPGGFLYTPPRDQFGGAAVLLPVSIPEFPVTWKQILALSELLFKQRDPYIAKPVLSVLNAGAKSGLARKQAVELIRYGFNVETIENADIEDIESSIVIPRTEEDRPLAEFFARILGMEVSPAPVGIDPEKLERITIIIGKNYAYKPLQDTVSPALP